MHVTLSGYMAMDPLPIFYVFIMPVFTLNSQISGYVLKYSIHCCVCILKSSSYIL